MEPEPFQKECSDVGSTYNRCVVCTTAPSGNKRLPLAASESGGPLWDDLGTSVRIKISANIYLMEPEPFQRHVCILEAPTMDVLYAAALKR